MWHVCVSVKSTVGRHWVINCQQKHDIHDAKLLNIHGRLVYVETPFVIYVWIVWSKSPLITGVIWEKLYRLILHPSGWIMTISRNQGFTWTWNNRLPIILGGCSQPISQNICTNQTDPWNHSYFWGNNLCHTQFCNLKTSLLLLLWETQHNDS